MDMTRTGYLVAEIGCEVKEGCMHIFSKDLPGFHLAVKPEDKCGSESVLRAVEWYFKAMKGLNVRVEAAASPLELLGGTARLDKEVRRVVMTPEFAFA